MASFWLTTGLLLAVFTLQIVTDDVKSIKARLEVKAFISDDAGKYQDLKVEYIGGIDPRLLFLENGEETERVALAEKSRVEINELLTSRGFTEKVESNDVEEGTEQGDETGKANEKVEF